MIMKNEWNLLVKVLFIFLRGGGIAALINYLKFDLGFQESYGII